MRCKIFVFILVYYLSLSSWSANCLLDQALKDPVLNANSDFWSEFNALGKKGKLSDSQFSALMKKHGGQEVKKSESKILDQPRSLQFSVSHKAEKEVSALPKSLRQEFDKFLEVVVKPNGLQEIRSQPGKWRLEKVVQFGENARTVRLNGGYRILFDVTPTGVTIRRVNKDQIHGHWPQTINKIAGY